jgi:hypothetical protein
MSPSNIDTSLDQSSCSSLGHSITEDESGDDSFSTESLSGKKDAPHRKNGALKLMQRVLPKRSKSSDCVLAGPMGLHNVYGMFRGGRNPEVKPSCPTDLEASDQGDSDTEDASLTADSAFDRWGTNAQPNHGKLLKVYPPEANEFAPALQDKALCLSSTTIASGERSNGSRRAPQRQRSNRIRRSDSSEHPTQAFRPSRQHLTRSSSFRMDTRPHLTRSTSFRQDTRQQLTHSTSFRQDSMCQQDPLRALNGKSQSKDDNSLSISNSVHVRSYRTRQRSLDAGTFHPALLSDQHHSTHHDTKSKASSTNLSAATARVPDVLTTEPIKGPTRKSRRQQGPSSYNTTTTATTQRTSSTVLKQPHLVVAFVDQATIPTAELRRIALATRAA